MRWRRVAKVAGGSLLAIVALVALVIGGALTWVRTERGGAWLLRTIVPRVNDQIAGHLTVTSLRLQGWRLELRGVTLRTPEGQVVAEAAQVEVAARPLALLRRRLVLQRVALQRPVLRLVQDERGLNLQRAVAAKLPTKPTVPKQHGGSGPSLSLKLDTLVIRDGVVDFRARLPRDRRHLRVEDIALDGNAAYWARNGGVTAVLRGKARADTPYPAPIVLDLAAYGAGERGQVRLFASIGDSVVALDLRAHDRKAIDLNIDRLEIEPALVQALAPGAAGPGALVKVSGHVRRAGPTVTANLELRAGRGQIRTEASIDPDTYVLRGLRLTGKAVDLAALLRDGPSSQLDFNLDARGRGHDLASLRGEVKLEMPPGRLGQWRAGPVRVHARAEETGYKLVELLAELPGLSLRGHGDATARTVKLEGNLVARDLSATVRALQGQQRLPAVGGSGALALQVTGALNGPRLEARGRFPSLRFEANRADQLEVVAAVPDLRRPQLAEVRLRAARLQLGERRLRDARVAVASQPSRGFQASVAVAEPALALEARGQWTEDLDGLTLAELRLTYPEAQWRLERPARLRFGEGLVIQDLSLASGPQRIAVSLEAGRRLVGKVLITDLDVGKLPQALLPPSLKLAGTVDLDAAVAGTAARPRGHATLAITGGRFQKLEGLEVKLEARHDGRRLLGTLDGKSSEAKVAARFDLPATWPPPERAPVSLALDVPEFDIPGLLASVGARAAATVRGKAALKASIDGTFAHPRATVDAKVRRLVIRGETLGDATLALALTTPPEGIDTRLRLSAFGGRAEVRARAPLTLARLAHASPQALRRTPLTITASADQLPLRPLARLAGSHEIQGGTLTLRLEGHGTARAPAGEVKLRLEDLAGKRFPATDALVELSVDEQQGNKVAARISRRGQELATLEASVDLPAARLVQLPALAAAPLAVHAHLGPVRVQRGALPPPTERDKERALSGLVEIDLRLDGTLRAPRLRLTATAEDARLDKQALGRAEVVVRYQQARPELSLNLATPNGGALHLTGSAELDLAYPRVLRPIDPKVVPISVDLESKALDLAMFSGLVRPLRTVAGQLTANARVRGRAGAPEVEGRLEWEKGRLVIADLGGYDDIHLLIHGNGQQVVLEDLSTRSGSGTAKLTARGVRQGESFKLETSARLDRFPLYTQGQPLAALSLEAGAKGTASPRAISLTTRISEAHVVLASGKRKKLQALNRPADVVLLDQGKPLNREQARKLQRLVKARGADTAVAQAPVAAGASPRRIRMKIEAPRNLWIEGPDVHLELGLDDDFLVSVNDEPRVFGAVLVKRGRVEVLGRRFDVDSGSTVRFTGPPDRPTLSVKATHEARKAGLGVRIAVEGPSDNLDLKLSSPEHPELGDTELLTLLATGHLPDERSGGTAAPGTQAMSVLGGVVAGKLQQSLSGKLPLDVLVIEPGEGLTGARLEAGTYLTDSLYVAWVGRVAADPFRRENRNEVQLEYQLTRRWSFQGTFGDARRGSADLVWTKNY